MNESDYMNWLIEYHVENNLENWLTSWTTKNGTNEFNHLKDGHIITPKNDNLPVQEGQENEQYKGVFIFTGKDLLDRLVTPDSRGMPAVERERIDSAYKINGEKDNFFSFLASMADPDGVYVEDKGSLYRCFIRPPAVPMSEINQKVPLDFIFQDGKGSYNSPQEAINKKMGTKTYLALALPTKYDDIEGVGLKRAAYGRPGLGKVIKTNSRSLSSSFQIDHFNKDEMSPQLVDKLRRNYGDFEEGFIGTLQMYDRTPSSRAYQKGPDDIAYVNLIQTLKQRMLPEKYNSTLIIPITDYIPSSGMLADGLSYQMLAN